MYVLPPHSPLSHAKYLIYDTNDGKPVVKIYSPALQYSLYRNIVNLLIQESKFTNNDLCLEGMHECVHTNLVYNWKRNIFGAGQLGAVQYKWNLPCILIYNAIGDKKP